MARMEEIFYIFYIYVRLFSKRSHRFSHEIDLDLLDLYRFNFPRKERGEAEGGGGSVIFGEEFAARYIERAMRKKPGGQKVLWVLIRRTSGRVP